MSKALKKQENEIEIMWQNPHKIKGLFAPTLTLEEFGFFMGLSKLTQANPFKGEIWAVKYDKSKPAAVFLGRNHYRKVAHNQENYGGHLADVVCANDKFVVETGVPKHTYNLKDRGKILGAYGLAWRKGQENPNFLFVDFDEYNQNQFLWKKEKMPKTMIKKVAESQILRQTWQEAYGNAYDESEAPLIIDMSKVEDQKGYAAPAADPALKNAKKNNVENGLDYQKLETMALDKYIEIEKVKAYLKSKGLNDFSDIAGNKMLYDTIKAELSK